MIVRTHQPRLAGGAAAGAGITGIGVWRPLKAKPIDEHVAALLPEQTPRAVGRALKAILKRVPIESVYCNDEHATPITMMRDSWADLCARTPGLDLASEGVDMVIWCGADKGCIEPGQAALACEVLGFSNTEWLDVSEACNGWLRALEIAQMYVHSAVHKRVLIMSAQENNIDFRPGNNAINSLLELPVRFAGYTIAAVATATLVRASLRRGRGPAPPLKRRPTSGQASAHPLRSEQQQSPAASPLPPPGVGSGPGSGHGLPHRARGLERAPRDRRHPHPRLRPLLLLPLQALGAARVLHRERAPVQDRARAGRGHHAEPP
jgi:hypothetical protein